MRDSFGGGSPLCSSTACSRLPHAAGGCSCLWLAWREACAYARDHCAVRKKKQETCLLLCRPLKYQSSLVNNIMKVTQLLRITFHEKKKQTIGRWEASRSSEKVAKFTTLSSVVNPNSSNSRRRHKSDTREENWLYCETIIKFEIIQCKRN